MIHFLLGAAIGAGGLTWLNWMLGLYQTGEPQEEEINYLSSVRKVNHPNDSP